MARNFNVPLKQTKRTQPSLITVEIFRQKLRENEVASAIAAYKSLYSAEKISELKLQDHVELLDHLTVHKTPVDFK